MTPSWCAPRTCRLDTSRVSPASGLGVGGSYVDSLESPSIERTSWNHPALEELLQVMRIVRSRGGVESARVGLALLLADGAELSRVCEKGPCHGTIHKRSSNTRLDTKTGRTEPVLPTSAGETRLNRVTLPLRPTNRKDVNYISKSVFDGGEVPRRAEKQIR